MNQKQKHNRNIINRYTIGALAVLIIAVTTYAGLTLKHNAADATEAPQTAPITSVAPMFSFTGAANWRQGPTNQTSMALFQDSHNCFTSVQYKQGTVDVAAERQERQANDRKLDLTSTPIDTLTPTLQTSAGSEQYQLQQYSASGSVGGQKVKGGQEFGYLQLESGYVEVEGHCDTAKQLPATLPALQNIKLNITHSL